MDFYPNCYDVYFQKWGVQLVFIIIKFYRNSDI